MNGTERARRDKAIVKLHGDGLSLDALALTFDLSRSRIHQIIDRERRPAERLPRGVTAHMGRYRVRRRIGGKQRCLGTYDTPEIAHQAYLNADPQRRLAHHPRDDIPEPDKASVSGAAHD